MQNLGYYNGKYDLIENMMIPMNDRVCWFGDGVYDVSCARNRIPHLFDAHIERFFNSAKLLRIEMPMTREELKKLTFEMMDKVDSGNVMIYWQVTRGTAARSHEFPKDVKANFWMTIRPKEVAVPEKPITLISVEDTRYLHCNIKTLNLIPNCMAEQAAKDAGCNTAVFHRGDIVTECAHSNVHIIKDGKIITHNADNLILPGIARANLLRLADVAGIEAVQRPFTMDELMNADEVFTTSTTALCSRVSTVDGKPVGMKDEKTFKKLQDVCFGDFFAATEKK